MGDLRKLASKGIWCSCSISDEEIPGTHRSDTCGSWWCQRCHLRILLSISCKSNCSCQPYLLYFRAILGRFRRFRLYLFCPSRRRLRSPWYLPPWKSTDCRLHQQRSQLNHASYSLDRVYGNACLMCTRWIPWAWFRWHTFRFVFVCCDWSHSSCLRIWSKYSWCWFECCLWFLQWISPQLSRMTGSPILPVPKFPSASRKAQIGPECPRQHHYTPFFEVPHPKSQ